MRNESSIVGGLFVGWSLFVLGVWGFLTSMALYGLYLAFSASVILGFCMFLLWPLFPISGLLQTFFDFNLPMQILQFITTKGG